MNEIMRKNLFFLLLALGATVRPLSAQSEKDRPNIIFVLVDDQRYDFLSFLGHPWIETPHIDRLAGRSIYFTNAFVTTSLCSPSRASILTGQYAHTHQVIDNDTPVPGGTPTFPVELQRGGYTTAFIGKWHMGGADDRPRPGFDYWASFKGQGPYNDPTMNINGRLVSKEGYTPDILTDLAVDFIREQAPKEQPYCLYLSHKSIHESFVPAPRHQGRYEGLQVPHPASYADTPANYRGKPNWLKRQRRSWHGAERDYGIQDYGSFDRFFQLYSECMLGVDESVGRIVAALEAQGQLEETIIIYFSDNGYMMGEQGLIDKRVMYEPSIRVPCFVYAPTLAPKSRREDRFVLNIDIGPTMLDMAGIEPPASMHGVSFLPLIRGEAVNWREAFLYEYFNDPNAVQTPTIFGLRTQRYSYMTYHGVWDLYELYDLQEDPDQRRNLLGGIIYGNDYGTFVRHVRDQAPELFPLVEELEKGLEQELIKTGGSRTPVWRK